MLQEAGWKIAKERTIVKPYYYNKGTVECIEAIRSSLSEEGFCGYLKGNIMKYIWRYEDKGQKDDLIKARDYLIWLIQVNS